MPTIVDQINDMQKAGVPSKEIENFKNNTLQEMQKAGVPTDVISKEFGTEPYDRSDIKSFWQKISSNLENEFKERRVRREEAGDKIEEWLLGSDRDYQFTPYLKRGIGNSGINKIIRYHSGGEYGLETNFPEIEGTGFLEKLTEGATGMVAEIPTFLPGAIIGGFKSGPGGAVIGGGLTAGSIQGIYTEALKRGKVKSWGEWWDIFMEEGINEGAKTAAKLYAAYKIPNLKLLSPLTNTFVGKTLTQSTAFTATGVAMGEDLPNADDFAVTTLLFAPFNVRASKQKLDNVVATTQKKPIDIINDMVQDRTIWEDLNSKNIENVRAYKDQTIEKPVEKPKEVTIEELNQSKKNLDPVRTELDKTISDQPFKRTYKMKDFVDDLFYNFIDKLHVFKRAEKQAEKFGVKYEKEISPYESFNLLNGVRGKIEAFVEMGAYDFTTGKKVGPSLKQIFKDNKITNREAYNDFKRYSISKRAIEKAEQGFETGVNIKAAKEFVKQQASKFEKPFRDLVKSSEYALKFLLDSGVITRDVYNAVLKANRDYVPFYREFLDDAKSGQFSKNVGNPLKIFKGSQRKITDPFDSIYNNISTYISIAERNAAHLKFIEFIEKSRAEAKKTGQPDPFPEVQRSEKRTRETKISKKELENIVDNVDALKPEVVNGFSVFRKEHGYLKKSEIVVYRKGVREVWEVGESFARPLKSVDAGMWTLIANALSLPSRTLRAGATGAVEFMYNNVQRDAFTSSILSKGWFPPFYQTIQGAGIMIKPLRTKLGLEPVFEKYVKSGALQNSLVTLDRTYFSRDVQQYFTKTKPINYIKNLPEFFRIYLEFSEGINRAGNFKINLERNLKKGLPEDQAIKKAAFETRENPIDYRRMGAMVQGINQISAFFNARIQGLNQTIKAFKDRPVQTYAKVFMYVQLPSILLWLANHDDPDYQDLPQWRKDLFWNVKVNGTYYPVPKPFEIGLIFGTGTERFLDYYFDQDPKAIEKFKNAVTVQTFKGLIPMPDVLKPFVETWSNRNYFFDRPIIPSGLEGIPSEYQYTDYTSETMKLIGKLIRKINGDDFSKSSSPLVLENAYRGWTGGIGGYVLMLSDSILKAAGVTENKRPRKKMLSEYPVLKALLIKNPDRNAEPVTDFRKLYEPVRQRIKAINILKKKGQVDEVKKQQSKLPKNWVILERAYRAIQTKERLIRNINDNPKENPEAKLYLTNILLKQMINESKHAVNLYYGKEVYTIKLDNE